MSEATTEFARRLIRALEGEHFGETLFSELAHRRSAPDEIKALRTLATLEQRMGHALTRLFEDQGIELPPLAPSRERGINAAARLCERPWDEFLAEFSAGTRHALAGYHKLRVAAPDPDHPTLVLLTEHEMALRDFAELTQDDAEDPLAPVHDVLHRLQLAHPRGNAPRTRVVTSIGLQTRALEVGDPEQNEAVVLLHGVPGSADHWLPLLSLIAPFARAVALDLPGFGRSDKLRDWEYSPNAYANFLAGALHDLGVARAHLVMNDLGGVGLFWAAAHPTQFASATLIDAGLSLTQQRWHLIGRIYRTPLLGRLAVRAGRLGYRQVMRLYLPQPRRIPGSVADDMRNEYSLEARWALLRFYRGANPPAWNRVSSALHDLDRPALVLWGVHDRFLRPREAHEQLRSFPNAEVVLLPDSGHYPHLDNPAAVNPHVVQFLQAQLQRTPAP